MLAASFLLAACRVDTAVVLRVNSNGSGRVLLQVHLDKAAVTAAEVDGRTLETALRLGDLSAAGWHISKWRRADSGASLIAWHYFEKPLDIKAILNEITGADSSFFRKFAVVHKSGALVDKYSAEIEIDPRSLKLELTSDAGISDALRNVGVDPEIVETSLNERAGRDLHFSLKANLPGGIISNGVDNKGRIALSTSSKALHLKAIALLILGVALVASAALLLLAGYIRERRKPHGRHATRHGHHGAHAPAKPTDEVLRHRPRGEHGKHAPRK